MSVRSSRLADTGQVEVREVSSFLYIRPIQRKRRLDIWAGHIPRSQSNDTTPRISPFLTCVSCGSMIKRLKDLISTTPPRGRLTLLPIQIMRGRIDLDLWASHNEGTLSRNTTYGLPVPNMEMWWQSVQGIWAARAAPLAALHLELGLRCCLSFLPRIGNSHNVLLTPRRGCQWHCHCQETIEHPSSR